MNDHNFEPYKLGKGNLSPEREREIRSQGGKECARKKREQRTIAETLRKLLYSAVTDPDMIEETNRFGLNEDGEAVNLDWLTARVAMNEGRKGTVESLRAIGDLIGDTGDSMKEDALAAFIAALTADDPNESE